MRQGCERSRGVAAPFRRPAAARSHHPHALRRGTRSRLVTCISTTRPSQIRIAYDTNERPSNRAKASACACRATTSSARSKSRLDGATRRRFTRTCFSQRAQYAGAPSDPSRVEPYFRRRASSQPAQRESQCMSRSIVLGPYREAPHDAGNLCTAPSRRAPP